MATNLPPDEPQAQTGDATHVDSIPPGFPCDQCAAEMTWDPDADALSCEYCGSHRQVPRGEGTIVERALDDVGQAARGFGVEVRVAKCGNCGASVSYEGSQTSEQCVYCGSANVLAQEANRNALRPESLVPLDLGRGEARAAVGAWISKLWFRPNALKKIDTLKGKGLYVPFWTFDSSVDSEWSADAGYYYWVPVTYTVMINGKPSIQTRMERRVRWEPAWGERSDAYDDDLVLASAGMSKELMQELGGFETHDLVPYKPEYLAGWCAEEYQVDLQQGWEIGQGHVESYQRATCAGDIPGDTHRNLRVRNRIFDVRWKHVLLPIWSMQYQYNKKTYTVLVNGQTGIVSGEAPYSWVKILGAVLAVAAIAGVIALFSANA